MIHLSEALYAANPDTLLPLNEQVAEEAQQALNSDSIKNTNKIKKSLADALNNIGFSHMNNGNIPIAVEYYYKSLKIREEINDETGIANCYNNLGYIYRRQDELDKALECYTKSKKILDKVGDKNGLGYILNNIGYVYQSMKNYKEAFKFFEKSYKTRLSINDKRGAAYSIHNIGLNFDKQGLKQDAMDYYQKALTIQEEINDVSGKSYTLYNIADLHFQLNDINQASATINESYDIAQELGYPEYIRNCANLLSRIKEKQGDYKGALDMYKIYIKMRDSLNNLENQKAVIQQEAKYEFEKAQIIKENEAKEKARIEAEQIQRRDNLEYSLIFLGILLLFGVVLMLGFVEVSQNVAEGLIFFSFLILFEFILVFAEPYINEYTDGEPIYTLLINAGIALLIFPLHDVLETKLKKRIVKN